MATHRKDTGKHRPGDGGKDGKAPNIQRQETQEKKGKMTKLEKKQSDKNRSLLENDIKGYDDQDHTLEVTCQRLLERSRTLLLMLG